VVAPAKVRDWNAGHLDDERARLLNAVEASAVVPENLLSRIARHLHRHKMIHRIGPVRVGVRIIRGDHHVVVTDSSEHIAEWG
jgi:hypothetical protein